jgi:heptosyltransferase II
MRILIIAPNWIGDAVMSQPLLALLKAQDPTGRIEVLAPGATAPVYQAMPEVAEVLSAQNISGKLQLRMRWRLGRLLARRKFDRCYVLPNSAKSALAPWFARIPQRIGHRGEARVGLLNKRHDPRPARQRLPGEEGRVERTLRMPMVEHYAQLAFAPGAALPGAVADPILAVPAGRQIEVREKFGIHNQGPVMVLCPGAEYGPAKRWPPRHFAALAVLMRERWPNTQVLMLGSAKERPLATEIAALSGQPLRNLCGETSLPEALALIALAHGVVSNDSGLMHVAAALRRPQVALFGSSDPRHTPPRSPLAQIQWLELACSPCFERQCPLGHLDCLNKLTPARAFESLSVALQQKAARSSEQD